MIMGWNVFWSTHLRRDIDRWYFLRTSFGGKNRAPVFQAAMQSWSLDPPQGFSLKILRKLAVGVLRADISSWRLTHLGTEKKLMTFGKNVDHVFCVAQVWPSTRRDRWQSSPLAMWDLPVVSERTGLTILEINRSTASSWIWGWQSTCLLSYFGITIITWPFSNCYRINRHMES